MRELIAKALATAAILNVAEAVTMGRESTFADIADQIGAWQWSAILDEKTCPICRELDGQYFDPNDPVWDEIRPPAHIGCRCIPVAVLKEELENFPVQITTLTGPQVDAYTARKYW
jgi:SPP1 gp7 family putative phage head morphogenesis protein